MDSLTIKVCLLDKSGEVKSVEAQKYPVLDCGVLVHEGRTYSYVRGGGVGVHIFEEVSVYDTGQTYQYAQMSTTPAAQYLATHDVELSTPESAHSPLLRDAVRTLESLVGLLRRCERDESAADAARQCAVVARDAVARALNVAPQMPHQDAVAQLLFSSWADVGMRLGLPLHSHLTGSERHCISAEQLTDVARWVAERVVVYAIRVRLVQATTWHGEKREAGDRLGWVHAGDMPVSDIDTSASAPMTHGVDSEVKHPVKRVLHWTRREHAESFLRTHMSGVGEVCELTVAQLWEACRE